MDRGRDDGDIEWLGLRRGAWDDVVEELLAEPVLPLSASKIA